MCLAGSPGALGIPTWVPSVSRQTPSLGKGRPVSSRARDARAPHLWTIEEAEALLASLTGVLSARIVARPGGEVDEVHVLTTEAVSPKQTVRNVESALLAHFDLAMDHRKISVAQTSQSMPASPTWDAPPVSLVVEREAPRGGDRVLFKDQRIESENTHRIRVTVSIEWQGESYDGHAEGPNLPKGRIEATAEATLKAVEAATEAARLENGSAGAPVVLALEGIKEVEAFERRFVLVSVHGMRGRSVVSLAGAARVEANPEQSAVFATLEATDRWIRGLSH